MNNLRLTGDWGLGIGDWGFWVLGETPQTKHKKTKNQKPKKKKK